ncbi:MAG: M24 family metallopeptidase, partial [Acidimicrobiales bacterium]
MRRSADELAKMRRAGRVVAEMHDKIRAAIRPGVTTRQLDAIGREVIERNGARSNFLNYGGGPGAPPFPAVICASPNDVIVHGIPDDTVLVEGDIISIDCGAIIEGYHGDAAFTAPVGQVTDEAARLLEVTEASLFAGI